MSTQGREYLSKINIDVLVSGCEVARIAAVGVTAVKKDKRRLGVRLDDLLHVNWGGPSEDEIWITEASVELDWVRFG